MRLGSTGVLFAAAASGLLLSGCATHQYVDEQIAAVNSSLQQLSGSTDSRFQQLGARVDSVNGTAQQALQRANAAGETAAAAQKLAEGKLVYAVVSESDSVSFNTNQWSLSKDAQATLTAFADRLKSENKNVFVEIVGHGDPRGSVYANRVLGEKRALEVRRFLTDQGIPLNKMATVSWGEERSTATGTSAAALAADRRVTLRVLA